MIIFHACGVACSALLAATNREDEAVFGNKTLQTNKIHLTLDNFDRDEEIPPDCPFVLTSPRSLEACKQLGVRVRENAIR